PKRLQNWFGALWATEIKPRVRLCEPGVEELIRSIRLRLAVYHGSDAASLPVVAFPRPRARRARRRRAARRRDPPHGRDRGRRRHALLRRVFSRWQDARRRRIAPARAPL